MNTRLFASRRRPGTGSDRVTSLDTVLPVESLVSGTNLLIAGEPMTGKRDLLFNVLTVFTARNDGFVIVSGNQATESILSDIESRTGQDVNEDKISIVEVVSGACASDGRSNITQIVAPSDLTGIGIAFSTQFSRMAENEESPVCLGIHSLSQLLMYSDIQSVYRFLHVATGMVQTREGLGVYTIDKPAESDEVLQFQELVDGLIETRQNESGREFRVSGLPNVPRGWTAVGE